MFKKSEQNTCKNTALFFIHSFARAMRKKSALISEKEMENCSERPDVHNIVVRK